MSLPILLTVGDTARLLSVSEKTVRRMYRSGELAYVRIGRSGRYIRISSDDVHEWLRSRRCRTSRN
ncbi:helix-turn-helix domain-containing protein [Rhodococcus tibetensis]|uniref:Helix-turn-helix domain-containing protein n=1 Tax=Rhodococcus tibetensis TaxID=2965064 RepID=A0ABT1QDS3_9NOCA|nr:helix-turn-helix domain-containing protein [Rhodococcus sp. FXJ9.536]MCQ4120434.1 helix-turn-helix domain-containing protein [Rhodococcus sp. FXJ9.536]